MDSIQMASISSKDPSSTKPVELIKIYYDEAEDIKLLEQKIGSIKAENKRVQRELENK